MEEEDEEKIQKNSYVIALDENGKNLSSIEFSDKISAIESNGYNHITYIIGGSTGIDKTLLDNVDFKISFDVLFWC